MELLKQAQYTPFEAHTQIVSIYAAINGFCDDYPVKDIQRFEKEFVAFLEQKHSGVLTAIQKEKKMTDGIKKDLEAALKDFGSIFETSGAKA